MPKCLICGFESENLSFHIVKIHNLKTKDYKKIYNIKYVQSDRLRSIHKSNIDNKNPTKNKKHSKESIIKMKNNRKGKGINTAGKYERTPEIKNKISKGVVDAHFRGDFDSVKPGKGSFVFSKKSNKTIFARSTWEKDMLEIFDLHPKINSVVSEPFTISYMFNGSKHNYIPDFLVRYEDVIDSIWEVKRDDWLKSDPKTIVKIEALKIYCHKNNMNMFIVDSKILNKIKLYIKSIT